MRGRVPLLIIVCALCMFCIRGAIESSTLKAENERLTAENGELQEQLSVSQEKAVEISNPIDRWYQTVDTRYGNSHSDGFIAFVYANSWEAELKHLVESIGSDEADAYYHAVSQERLTLSSLAQVMEKESGWRAGSSGRISLAEAIVCKNGVYQLDPFYSYSDFVFDDEAATQALMEAGVS